MSDIRKWISLVEGQQKAKTNLLLELDWYDKSPLTAVLKRYPGKWIHFSNGASNRQIQPDQMNPPVPNKAEYDYGGWEWAKRMKKYKRDLQRSMKMNAIQKVPKLSANPNKFHRDPYGIYFYPVDFLLSGTDRIRSGHQYGFGMDFYYVCDINMADPRGIVLQKLTWQDIDSLASRNGWKTELDTFRSMSIEDQRKNLRSYADPAVPGGFLWHFVEMLQESNKITWNRAFRGVSFIYDDNGSIIHSNEPAQIVVFDRSIIRVIAQGDNPLSNNRVPDTDDLKPWLHALTSILKGVRGELGGELSWSKKLPRLNVRVGNADFEIGIPERRYTGIGVSVSYRFGRSAGSWFVNQDTLASSSMGDIIQGIVSKARRIAAKKSDLWFTPMIGETQAQDVIRNLCPDLRFDFKTTIHNPDGNNTLNWASILVSGTAEHGDMVNIRDRVTAYISPKEMSMSVTIEINGRGVAHGEARDITLDTLEDGYDQLASKLIESMELHFKRVSPENTYVTSWEKWTDPKEFAAYKGWLALNCGVYLDGRIEEHYKEDIVSYHAFLALPENEKFFFDGEPVPPERIASRERSRRDGFLADILHRSRYF